MRSGSLPETSLSFTGQRKDDTGLLYYHARYYDPDLGRFLSADTVVPEVGALTVAPSDKTAAPLFAKGGTGMGSRAPQELNRYAYANNNPLRYTDPTGHYVESALDLAGIAYDAYDIYNNGLTWTNGLSMAGNVVGLVLPGVTGVGAGVRAVAKSTQMGKAVVRTGQTVAKAGKAVGRTVGKAAGKVSKGAKGASRACSFSATTPVSTPQGTKPIAQVRSGDHVLAFDEALGTVGVYTVTEVIVHTDPVVEYVTIDGEELETTPEHPFYTQELGWVAARELWKGAHVRNADGNYRIVQRKLFVQRWQPMYNLGVEQAHTYFVGDGRWLVHNANCIIDINDPGKILGAKGFVENPNRPGSWGKNDYQRKGRTIYREYWRVDKGEPGAPGWRGEDHVHHYELEDHLDPKTPFDPDAPYAGNKK